MQALKGSRSQSDTGQWLRGLVDEALDNGNQLFDQSVPENDLELMVKWMGKLFDEFELYALEFNRNAAGTDLIVTCSPVNLENTTPENDVFEAHVSTRFWALAFDASSKKVDVYLMPATLLLAFTTNRIEETEYKPFITIQATRHVDRYFWTIDQQLITFEMLAKLARELFGDLIKVASGNMKETEVYGTTGDDASSGIAAAAAATDSVDRTYEPDATTASFEAATGTDLLKPHYGDSSLTAQFWLSCENITNAIAREIEHVKAAEQKSGDLSAIVNCKKTLIELESFRLAAHDAINKLRTIADR